MSIFSILSSTESGWTAFGLLLAIIVGVLARAVTSDIFVSGKRLQAAEAARDQALELLKGSEAQKDDLLNLNILIAEKMHREVPGAVSPPTGALL